MIRASEEFRLVDWQEVKDPVMQRLMKMGIFDWKNEDTRLNQSVAPMRHATALGSRLLGRLLQVEKKVGGVIRRDDVD